MKKINVFILVFSFLIPFSLLAKTFQTLDGKPYDGIIISLKEGVDVKEVMKTLSGEPKSASLPKSEMKEDKVLGRDIILLNFSNKSNKSILSEKSMKDLLSDLNSHPGVEFAEPNFIYSTNPPAEGEVTPKKGLSPEHFIPIDPKFSKLWGLKNDGGQFLNRDLGEKTFAVKNGDIDALGAWDISKGSKFVKIAVIDTGVDYNHPELKDQIYTNIFELYGLPDVDDDGNGYIDDIHGYDFFSNDGDPMDEDAHGTHVSGTIGAAHNKIGVTGIMKNVTIIPIRFLGPSGTTLGAVKSIEYAIKQNVDIMNNSWGGGGFSILLEKAIKAANAKGILFVAAAGNTYSGNDTDPHYPSNYQIDNVISVGAIKANLIKPAFSNYGQTVHIFAPGSAILSTVLDENYASFAGTSMATPHISGILGLLIAHEPGITPKDAKKRLMQTATRLSTLKDLVTDGSGMVDAHRFLDNRRTKNPDSQKWQTVKVEVFDMTNYQNDLDKKITYNIPGAKYIRLKLKEMDIEQEYDLLEIRDGEDRVVDVLTGSGSDVASYFAEGDTIKLVFRSDYVQTFSGFIVDELEVIFDK